MPITSPRPSSARFVLATLLTVILSGEAAMPPRDATLPFANDQKSVPVSQR